MITDMVSRLISSRSRMPAWAGILFLAVPACAGWAPLPAPRVPEGAVLRDWRGMETCLPRKSTEQIDGVTNPQWP